MPRSNISQSGPEKVSPFPKHRIGNHNFLAIAIQENRLTARPEAGSGPHEEIAVDAGLAPPYNLNPFVVKLLTLWSIASIAPWAHGVNGKRNSEETITCGMLGISSSNTTSIYGMESHIFSAWFDQNEPQIDVYARPLRILVSSAARQTPDWQSSIDSQLLDSSSCSAGLDTLLLCGCHL